MIIRSSPPDGSESDDESLEATEPAKTVKHTTSVNALTGAESTLLYFEYGEELEPVPEDYDVPTAAVTELCIPTIKSARASALVSALPNYFQQNMAHAG